MKIETKLILCSILAIVIGVATIAPLAFFMSSARAQTTNDIPWFNLNVPFASYAATSQNDTNGYLIGEGPTNGLVSYSSTYTIGLNATVNPDAVNTLENARMEYYQLQVYSDQGQIANMTYYVGANCTSDISPPDFEFSRDNWFNTSTSGGGVFFFNFNGTLGIDSEAGCGAISGTYSSSSFTNTTLPQEFLNIQNAQTIYIDVYRLGYVTFNGNSTIITLANNQVIQHVELTKNGDEFAYGTIPENMRPKTIPMPEPNP